MEWIKVTDKLPAYSKQVVTYRPSYLGVPVTIGILVRSDASGHVWKIDGTEDINTVTQWAELPSPPGLTKKEL